MAVFQMHLHMKSICHIPINSMLIFALPLLLQQPYQPFLTISNRTNHLDSVLKYMVTLCDVCS